MNRTRNVLPVLVLAALVLTGCGSDPSPGVQPEADTAVPTSSPRSATPDSTSGSHTLGVAQVQPRPGEPILEEGFRSFVVARGDDGRKHVLHAKQSLPAGHYLVRAWIESCDGNCSVLDGPADGCRHDLDLARDTRLQVALHTARACVITTS